MSMAFAESIQAMVSLQLLSLDITSLCRNHLEALLSELRVMPRLNLQRLKLGSLKDCEYFVEYAGTNLKTLCLPSMICFQGQFEHLEELYIHEMNFNNPILETSNIARAFPRLKTLGFLQDRYAESYQYSRLDPCQVCVRDVLPSHVRITGFTDINLAGQSVRETRPSTAGEATKPGALCSFIAMPFCC